MPDKSTLKRAYRDTPTRAGVYLIRHRPTQRRVVAGSLNVEGALNRHRFELSSGSHRNRQLQSDWRHDGAEAFDIEILDRVRVREVEGWNERDELAALVALWRDELAADGAADYGLQGCGP